MEFEVTDQQQDIELLDDDTIEVADQLRDTESSLGDDGEYLNDDDNSEYVDEEEDVTDTAVSAANDRREHVPRPRPPPMVIDLNANTREMDLEGSVNTVAEQ